MARSTAFEILAKQYRDAWQEWDSAEGVVDAINSAKLVRFTAAVEGHPVAESVAQPGDYALAWDRGREADGTKKLVAWCPGLGAEILHGAHKLVTVIEDATGPILPPEIETKLGEFDRTLSLAFDDATRLSISDAVRGLLTDTYKLGAIDGRTTEEERCRKLAAEAEAAARAALEGIETKIADALAPLFSLAGVGAKLARKLEG